MSVTIAGPVPVPVPLPDPVTLACSLARRFEGFSSFPYQDGDGNWTIGFGATYLADGSAVTASTPSMTRAQADALLTAQMAQCVQDVDSVVVPPLNPFQTAALADFVFNEGFGAFRSSTLLKLLNAGDISGAAEQFVRWDIAGGEQMPGLLRRREAEVALFKTPWVAPALAPSLKDT
jgi:lysozyme